MNSRPKLHYVFECVFVLILWALTSDIYAFQDRSDAVLPTQKCDTVGTGVQESEARIEFGNLNRKAVSMPKPKYPADAKRAGIRGTVTVRVVIEASSGRVVWARVVSGPAALYKATLHAACAARFYPTIDADLYVGGRLTYDFRGPRRTKRQARNVLNVR
jgi:TonB family protein